MKTIVLTLPWLPKFDGWTVCQWLVLIRRGATADVLPHELRHTEQMRRDGWLRWNWRYRLKKPWRLEYEADAYAVSVLNGGILEVCARWLANSYGLGISEAQAAQEIQKRLEKQ